jgi:hypothetical protein
MVSFRNLFLLMTALVVLTGAAYAQPLTCVANAGVPPIARAEGLAEEVGQVVIECTGGTPIAVGQPLPTFNLQIFLTTNITSRLISGGSEAMLLIDEPLPANQLMCTAIEGTGGLPPCPATKVAVGNYDGSAAGRENVFRSYHGSQTPQQLPNSLTWLGVPFDPPGTAGRRTIRLVNVRANATAAPPSSTIVPSSIAMFISISGTAALPLANPQLTVAFVSPGLNFSTTTQTYNQCDIPTSSTPHPTITFAERFGTAFRHNNLAVSDVNNQSMPGMIYNTESMFSNAAWPVPTAGRATQGTRLIARFAGIPANVSISVPNLATGNGALVLNRWDGSSLLSAGSHTVALDSNRRGEVTWEVMNANPAVIESVTITVTVSYSSNPLPGLGPAATAAGNYAPLSSVDTASGSAPVPRFIDSRDDRTLFTIVPCQTNLLYPFVSNQAGFDTGLVVSNTSRDPYGTAHQNGTCEIFYYGNVAGGSAPASQVSPQINAGEHLIFSLYGGNPNQSIDTRGRDFQGYIIIRCNFQYGHGFAFVSDLGAQKVAMGYIPLVLDGMKTYAHGHPTRTRVRSETLNQ